MWMFCTRSRSGLRGRFCVACESGVGGSECAAAVAAVAAGVAGATSVARSTSAPCSVCSICSRVRSGARPAQSRSRRTSRACEKYSSASTASPRKAAIPTYAPTRSTSSTLLLRERLDVLAGAVLRRRADRREDLAGELCQRLGEIGLVPALHQPLDPLEDLLDPLRLELDALGAQDAVRVRGDRTLARAEQLLAQLFACPCADDLDRDLVGLVARQPDHVACEVDDLHLLAHLEHE